MRCREREALLKRAQVCLEADERVVAAWLFGSLGRGTEDALSDLDLFVAVADTHAPSIIANHDDFIAQLDDPLLILDAPQNRPPEGAYNMVLYPGEQGPHQVDWYWQPQSLACIPQQTRVLLDRVGLPHLDTPPHFEYQPIPERDRLEVVAQTVNFFWVMLLITAKYVARSPHEEKMGLVRWAFAPLREVEEFVGADRLPSDAEEEPHPDPGDKLRLLRKLASRMEALMPQVEELGAEIPTHIVAPAYLYLDFIESLVQPSADNTTLLFGCTG
jgi:predicted nucleotidyltransferase